MTSSLRINRGIMPAAEGCFAPPPADAKSTPAPSPAGRVVALDGLRGVAIGGVLLVHLFVIPLQSARFEWLRAPLGIATHGVDLFFVLSGYLIGGILLDNRNSPRRFSTFWLRRLLRIVPLYAITMILLLGFMLEISAAAAPWWSYALFVSNFYTAANGFQHWPPVGVMWSLSVEEQFYILAPVLVFYCRPDRLPRYLAAIILISYTARWIILGGWGPGNLSIHFLTICRVDTLALGVLVAWLVRHPTSEVSRWLKTRWPLLAGAAALATIAYALTDTSLANIHAVAYGYTAVALLSALAVFAIPFDCASWLSRLLESRVLVSFGRYAYFLYLWHQIVAYVVNRLITGEGFPPLNSAADLGRPVAIVAITWAAAAVSWRLFEQPLINLGHKVAY